MRLRILVAALLLAAGCSRGNEAPAPPPPRPAPVPAPAAGDGGTIDAGAAEAGPPLPSVVDLVRFDLASHDTGLQDYQAVSGNDRLQVHLARGADGLAHAWASGATSSAWRQGDTTWTMKEGRCTRRTGRAAEAAFAMLGAPYVAGQGGPLAPLSLRIPSSALRRKGTATVAGIPVTTYTLDATEPLLGARARVEGEVALDGDLAPLESHGRIEELAGASGSAQVPPLTWTFTSSHLGEKGAAVTVTLPDACRGNGSTSVLDDLPMPPGAKKGTTLGDITSYRVPWPARRTEAFFMRALPAHGWRIEATPSPLVFRIRRRRARASLTLIPMGEGVTQVGVMVSE